MEIWKFLPNVSSPPRLLDKNGNFESGQNFIEVAYLIRWKARDAVSVLFDKSASSDKIGGFEKVLWKILTVVQPVDHRLQSLFHVQ